MSAARVSVGPVARGIAARSLVLIPRLPSTFIPSLVMPVFLTIAFSGPFSGITRLPDFPADKIIDWVLPWATIMGAAFAGVTTGLGVARDFQNGFYDRLLVSPVPRAALVAGPMLASMLRALLPLTLLTVVAFIAGANFKAGFVGYAMLLIAVVGIAAVAGAWSLGLAMRFRTMQVAPLMQMGVFLSVFLSTAQMPINYLNSWLHAVARFNPMTNVLALARQGFLGDVTWSQTWPGLASLAGMAAVLVLFAARSMRSLSLR